MALFLRNKYRFSSFHVKKVFRTMLSVVKVRQSVLVTRPDVPEPAIKMLKESFDVEIWPHDSMERKNLLASIAGKNGIYCFVTDKINEEFFKAAGPDFKVVSTMSAGYDHIDVEACKKFNVAVGHTPNVLTDATAELCVGLLLATSRRLIEATKEVTNGGWSKWEPMYMTGSGLKGSTVGIVGLGNIGLGIARRLKPFQVSKFLYWGRSPKPYATELELNCAQFVTFDELLRNSDFVIVSCALNDQTRGLFDRKAFSQMKPNAIFINISRGAIVDQDALYEALTTGKIHAAGLDVTTPEPLPQDHKLTSLKNCVILPHIGSATRETRTEMAELTARNLVAGLTGTKMPYKLC